MAATDAILVVGAAGTLTADDTWAQGKLAALGYTVTLHTAANAVPAGAADAGVVVFSTSMANNQASKWDAVDVPVVAMSMEKYLYAAMATQNFLAGGDARLTRFFVAHDSNGGRSGVVTVYDATPAVTYRWLEPAKFAAGVVLTSFHDSSLSRVTSIAIPAGAALTTGTAISNRVALPIHLWSSPTVPTTEAEDLFADAVAWAAGPLSPPDPPATPVCYYSADGVTSAPAELYYSADGVTSVRVDLA